MILIKMSRKIKIASPSRCLQFMQEVMMMRERTEDDDINHIGSVILEFDLEKNVCGADHRGKGEL